MPNISVIVPVYKVEPYLCRCVDSLLNQSYGDFEVILVDDGSPDRCPGICDAYEQRDKRVRVIHQKNGGLSAARNSGIQWALENSDSRWLTFIDSDDWVHRDYLKLLWEGVGENVKISACSYARVAEPVPDTPVENPEYRILDSQEAYCSCYGQMMTACCKLVRKDLFETLRFPVGKLHEDGFITHILTFEAGTAAVLDAPLYYYYFNPDSITRSQWKPGRLDEIRAHELRLTYLQVRGYEKAWNRELEIYIMTLYEHVSALSLMEDRKYAAHLKSLLKKLRLARKEGKKQGLYPLNAEFFWLHLMALTGPGVWRFARKVNQLRHNLRKG